MADTSEMRESGSGWISFAGVIFILAGTYNVIAGISALVNKGYFIPGGVLYGTLFFWGVIWLILGVIQLAVSALLFARSEAGRIIGLTIAVISAVVWMFNLGLAPLWATANLVVDVMIIYGLSAHSEAFMAGRPQMPSPT